MARTLVRSLTALLVVIIGIVAYVVTDRSRATLTPLPKPIERDSVFVSYKVIPKSLEDMVLNSDAIVIGTIGTSTVENDGPELTTVYSTQLQRIVLTSPRLPAQPGQQITVAHRGGVKDFGDHIEIQEVSNFPQYKKGHRYLLFLKWNPIGERWTDAFGASSAVDVTSQTASSPASSPISNRNGDSVDSLIASIEAIESAHAKSRS